MVKLRLLVFSVLVVVAVGAVTASTASAAFTLSEEKCDGGKVAICWDSVNEGTNLRELVGEENYEIKLKKDSLLETALGGNGIHIECLKGKVGEGKVIQNSPLTVATTIKASKIDFEECKTLKPTNCTVPVTISTKGIAAEAVNQGIVTEGILIKSTEANELFTTITFSGAKCPLNGLSIKVKGSQVCLWLPILGPILDLKGQEAICEHGESKLKASEEPATFETEFLLTMPTLEKDDFWDVELA